MGQSLWHCQVGSFPGTNDSFYVISSLIETAGKKVTYVSDTWRAFELVSFDYKVHLTLTSVVRFLG